MILHCTVMGGAGSGGHSKAEARDIADHWEKLSQLGPSDLVRMLLNNALLVTHVW